MLCHENPYIKGWVKTSVYYSQLFPLIKVYDKLHMLNPAMEAKDILMAPNSGLKLQTSR